MTRGAGPRTTHAIGLLFVANGLSLPTLLPRLPEIKDAVGADAATFGLALVGTGVGGLLGSVVAPRAIRRLDPRRCAVGAALLLAGAILLVALAGSVAMLFVAFAVMGVTDGVADTAQNHLLFEEQRRRPGSLTSRMHALWSIGALGGTAAGTVAVGAGVGVLAQTVVVGAIAGTLVLAAAAALRGLRPGRQPGHHDGAPVRPEHGMPAAGAMATDVERVRSPGLRHGALRWGPVAVAAVAVAAVEGVANEWSALTLRDGLDASETLAGAGPTAFAAAMLAGRLAGDRLIDRVGRERASRLGGGAVAVGGGAGLLGGLLGGPPLLLVLGLVAAGVGAAVLFPLMLAAGDLRDASGVGIAVASALARIGFLGVPVTMGMLADAVGLGPAFALLPVAGAVVAGVLPRALSTPARAGYL